MVIPEGLRVGRGPSDIEPVGHYILPCIDGGSQILRLAGKLVHSDNANDAREHLVTLAAVVRLTQGVNDVINTLGSSSEGSNDLGSGLPLVGGENVVT